jgi:prevent-host-death family protein
MPDQVGVRELRDRLSSYLARAQAGEEIEVTDRGQPIALLVPLPQSRAAVAELVAAGQVRLAGQRWRPGSARIPVPDGVPLPSETLDAERTDRL